MLKRTLSAFLAFIFLISLISCTKSKTSLKSSKTEQTVIGEINGVEIPLEIYRYVAMNCKKDMDTGEEGLWTGEEGEKLLSELNSRTDETVIRLYTVPLVAEKYGVDPYSDEINIQLDAQMEGIYADYEHDYGKYAEDLKASCMNDSVLRFILRNDILSAKIVECLTEKGDIEEYSDDFAETVLGDAFVRIKNLLVSNKNHTPDESKEIAEMLFAKLGKGEDYDSLLERYGEDLFMFNNPDGYYIHKGIYYDEFENAAFSLKDGETSAIIETPAGYGILKRYPKETEYIKDNLSDLYETYRDGIYNLTLNEFMDTLNLDWNDQHSRYTVFNMDTID